MKKRYFMIGLAMALSLATQSIAMAQNDEVDSSAIETVDVKATALTEISTGTVPYRPDVPVEVPESTNDLHYLCVVTGVDEGSSLNVRNKPSTSGTIIGSFAANASITCEYMGDHVVSGNWWYATGKDKATGKKISGYVSADYVNCEPTRSVAADK